MDIARLNPNVRYLTEMTSLDNSFSIQWQVSAITLSNFS